MTYSVLKALHLISLVSWFAGLFYIVRLFIYHTEAFARPTPEKDILCAQFEIMERRLWFGITVPAMISTAVFGFWLAAITQAWGAPWFHLKLFFILILWAYHFHCGRIRRRLTVGIHAPHSKGLRLFNEVATVLLVAIVFTVSTKNLLMPLWGVLGFLALGMAITVGLKIRRRRNPT